MTMFRSIVKNYRPDPMSGNPSLPTPREFVQYVLDNIDLDQHWRPQVVLLALTVSGVFPVLIHRACPAMTSHDQVF